MSTIIDRRLNPRDKNVKNRQKFIERSRRQIKEVVRRNIKDGKIADIENGKAKIRVKGIGEPEFRVDPKTGDKKYVMPGNRKYVPGDIEPKPEDEDGEGGTEGGLGEGEDDFEFVLSQDEYLDFIFEDLELPDMVKKQMKDVTKMVSKRAGYTNQGNPSQLDVIRSLKNSLGRRIGLKRPDEDDIKELEDQLAEASDEETRIELIDRIAAMKQRMVAIPWLDPFDVRYRNFIPTPQPMTKAVMFCIMDVSGSMGEFEKDIAKRFFFLLHMFLNRKYTKVDIVFIRHHESATECDEDSFFHDRASGGTQVSTGLELTRKIITERYPLSDWNIYVAQASDGDNFANDNDAASAAMSQLLPLAQFFAYVEIGRNGLNYGWSAGKQTDLWKVYTPFTEDFKNLVMRKIASIEEIWQVFRDLFTKE